MISYWQPCRKKYEMSCGPYSVWSRELKETDQSLIMPENVGQCTCFETKKKEELRQKTWNSWITKLIKAPIFDNLLSVDNK